MTSDSTLVFMGTIKRVVKVESEGCAKYADHNTHAASSQ